MVKLRELIIIYETLIHNKDLVTINTGLRGYGVIKDFEFEIFI
jgi:hypothetical protein